MLFFGVNSKYNLISKLNGGIRNISIDKSRLSYIYKDGMIQVLLDNQRVVVEGPYDKRILEITNLTGVTSYNFIYSSLDLARKHARSDLYKVLTLDHIDLITYEIPSPLIKRYPLFGNKVIDKRSLIINKIIKVMTP